MTRSRRTSLAFLIALLLLVACGGLTPGTPPAPAATATATAFPVASATPTPPPVGLWVSPDLPEPVRLAAMAGAPEAGYELVEREEGADIRFEIGGDRRIGHWTYALVAPFATVRDELPWTDFLGAWDGSTSLRLLAAPSTAGALAKRIGPAAGVELVGAGELAAQLEGQGEIYALVPFHQLQPRWKVLQLGASTPLADPFDPEDDPLSVSYGFSGEPALVETAAAQFELPTSNRDPSRMTTVALSGVTALTRATAWAIDRQGISWAVGEIAPLLAGADLTHISHEVAFSPDCPPVNPSRDISRFCGQPEQIEVLAQLGVDVIELTGNHVKDYGPAPLSYTLDRYEERGWKVYGGGRNLAAAAEPARFEHNGNRIAFLGCNQPGPSYAWATTEEPGALPCDLPALYDRVGDLREQGYLPIVTFQWAESYRRWPVPQQAEAFRAAAAAGAEVVSGSQAHQPMGFEFHQGAFIHYGPGNLFFDQMWSLETRQEFVDRLTFYEGELISVELTTWMLEDYARLRPMTAEERAEFLATMFAASGG